MKTHSIEILQFQAGQIQTVIDDISGEEPLELRLRYGVSGQRKSKALSVTMRTPGDDFSLAVGFLVSEGIISARGDIHDIRCLPPFVFENQTSNVVEIELSPTTEFDLSRLQRNFYTTSSCGVCGKSSLAAVQTAVTQTNPGLLADGVGIGLGSEMVGCGGGAGASGVAADYSIEDPKTLTKPILPGLICELPNQLKARQSIFHKTGGLHGAGLVERDGRWISVFEDVGRHNAVDKLIGDQLLNGLFPLTDQILVLSGRASFELIQKAVMARIFTVVAVGAPSSLAVELAVEFGITLIGFAATDRFNVYSHPQRLSLA